MCLFVLPFSLFPMLLVHHPCLDRPLRRCQCRPLPMPSSSLSQHLALNAPLIFPSPSWLCATQLFPAVRLCVTLGTPLDFVSTELPRCHLVSSISGVEGSLKCLPLLPLFLLTISLCSSKKSLLHISTVASIHPPLI